MPAVSVIIPVYKVEPYIARCARALFSQTMEDLEFIFVDDCTPDASIAVMQEVLQEFPERKEQVKVIRTPQNGGLARARLAGVAAASGRYLMPCDSDDAVDSEAYQLMYEKAVAEDLDIVTCDFRLENLKKARVQSNVSEPGREVSDILSGKVWATVWSRMFKRELWEDIALPEGGDMWEDVVFSVQATSRARRIGHMGIPLYTYYRRATSMSFEEGQAAALKRWNALCVNVKQVLDYLARTGVEVDADDIVSFKYRSRDPLIPYVQIPEYYRKWRDTYPEIDRVFLGTKGIPADTKFWFILIHLRLYYPWKRLTGAFRKPESQR
ncbi:MAG: glycosyltransferase family 2 protein [Bacteroidales bacterium]|nr:glycosyltransferase family 2 protein [Bacteroidales bacterium]